MDLVLTAIDKKGYFVTDLKPEELSIKENGVVTTSQAFLLKTDSAGKVLFATTFKGSDSSYGTSIFSSPNEGLFLFGSYDDWIPESKAETMVLFKLDSTGMVPGCRLFSSIKSSRVSFGDVNITTLKVSSKRLALTETSFEGSITLQTSASKVSVECQ